MVEGRGGPKVIGRSMTENEGRKRRGSKAVDGLEGQNTRSVFFYQIVPVISDNLENGDLHESADFATELDRRKTDLLYRHVFDLLVCFLNPKP